jgi:hypothetical protein
VPRAAWLLASVGGVAVAAAAAGAEDKREPGCDTGAARGWRACRIGCVACAPQNPGGPTRTGGLGRTLSALVGRVSRNKFF